MILKGSLNIVTDAQMAVQASASSRVLFVGELKDKNPANFITCSILLPPYEAIVILNLMIRSIWNIWLIIKMHHRCLIQSLWHYIKE